MSSPPTDMTQPRITPGDRHQVGLVNHAVASALGLAARTAPPHLFLTLGRHRRLFRGWLHFAGTLMPGGHLERRESEMVILRVANLRGCEYERDHHRRLGTRAGLSTFDIEALASDEAATDPRWTAREAALLTATDQLIADRDIDDEHWEPLQAVLDERELIELVMLVGHYDMLAMAITALRVQPDLPRRG